MRRAESVLLDTHALLWWKAGGERLSAAAGRRIADAESVLVSPMSCWEVGMLVAKGRVALDRSTAAWVRDLVAEEGVAEAPMSAATAVLAADLEDFHGDPVDRFLVASAIERRVELVTKDRRIRSYSGYPGFRTVW